MIPVVKSNCFLYSVDKLVFVFETCCVISPLSLKRKVRLVRSHCCLCVSVSVCMSFPLSTFEPINTFYEIQWRCHAIEDDFDVM